MDAQRRLSILIFKKLRLPVFFGKGKRGIHNLIEMKGDRQFLSPLQLDRGLVALRRRYSSRVVDDLLSPEIRGKI
jgi:hypothetical protein